MVAVQDSLLQNYSKIINNASYKNVKLYVVQCENYSYSQNYGWGYTGPSKPPKNIYSTYMYPYIYIRSSNLSNYSYPEDSLINCLL